MRIDICACLYVLTWAPYTSLGAVDSSTVEKVKIVISDAEKERLARVEARPHISEILNLHDFEVCRFLTVFNVKLFMCEM